MKCNKGPQAKKRWDFNGLLYKVYCIVFEKKCCFILYKNLICKKK